MKLSVFEAVARPLSRARVRYLVAGGLAVNAHGYVRFTADIGLVIALEADNAMVGELRPGLSIRFVSIPTLIQMKQAAGRPRDLDDIQHLRWILEDENQK